MGKNIANVTRIEYKPVFVMMKHIITVLWVLTMLLIAGCAGSKQTTSKTSTSGNYFAPKPYQEDLTDFRPRFEAPTLNLANTTTASAERPESKVQPTHHINQKIDKLLDSMTVYNRTVRYAKGFRIQIYNGNDRDEANKAKEKFYRLYPDITVYTTYKQPSFRVKVGDFLDKLEAQRMMNKLRPDFQVIVLLEEQINLPNR